MLKLLILIILTINTYQVSYQKFLKTKSQCGTGLCQYDIFNTNKLTNPDCGRDYYKSQICQTTFSDCKNIKLQDQYPLICYQCWAQSPSTSSLYQDFQDCIRTNVWELLFMGKIIIGVFVMFGIALL